MRVNQTNGNQVQGTETKRTGKAGQAPETKGSQPATGGDAARGSDAVKSDLSSKGKEFARARAVAGGAPDVREDKIAELKKRIRKEATRSTRTRSPTRWWTSISQSSAEAGQPSRARVTGSDRSGPTEEGTNAIRRIAPWKNRF